MKESIKTILKRAAIYHPLQSFYRSILFYLKRLVLRSRFSNYKGSGFLCNVCGNLYSRFADDHPSAENQDAIIKYNVIAGYGKNIICPHCLSTARERLIIALLEERKMSNMKILHLSPEMPVYNFLSHNNNVVTADFSPGFYRNIDHAITKADATKLPFDDHSFDLIIANHIMEHIPEDVKAMKEIFRVMRPGAKAMLQVPYSETLLYTMETPGINEPALQSKLYGQKDHVRIYAMHDYIARLQSAGFVVTKIPYESLERFHKYAIQHNESFLEITRPIS